MAAVSKALLRRVERIKAKIAKDRDELREIVDEVNGLDDDLQDAAASLEYAADAMSRLV